MDDRERKVAGLLHEAAELHHKVFRITDGADDDWASWYADWLLDHSELPQLLDGEPVRSHLVYHLVRLDREHAASGADEAWERYYARSLLAELGPRG